MGVRCTVRGGLGRVPPRRRRAGYQPAEPSQQMRDAIAAEAQALEDIDDDLDTIRATGQWFNALGDAILAIGEPRLRNRPAPRPGLVLRPLECRNGSVEDPGRGALEIGAGARSTRLSGRASGSRVAAQTDVVVRR